MDTQPDASVVELAKFAGYLLLRVEALDTLLIQKEIVSKEDIRNAVAEAERSMGQMLEIGYRDGQNFEHALTGTLRQLRARLVDRLRLDG